MGAGDKLRVSGELSPNREKMEATLPTVVQDLEKKDNAAFHPAVYVVYVFFLIGLIRAIANKHVQHMDNPLLQCHPLQQMDSGHP